MPSTQPIIDKLPNSPRIEMLECMLQLRFDRRPSNPLQAPCEQDLGKPGSYNATLLLQNHARYTHAWWQSTADL